MRVLLDLVEYEGTLSEVSSLRDLIASIQGSLASDRIIAHVSLDARPLSIDDWNRQLSSLRDATIELTTSDKNEYIRDRVFSAEHYIAQIGEDLKRSQDAFSEDKNQLGHNVLAAIVESLAHFSQWYLSLLELEEQRLKTELDAFKVIMGELKTVTNELIQSLEREDWPQLAGVMERRLRPVISDLTALCEQTANQLGS